MKQISGFKSEAQRGGGYEMLPAGLYIAGIRDVKLDGQEPDQQLIIRLDIIEGPYTGYYTRRYEAEAGRGAGRFPVRYKGDYRLQIPDEKNPKRQHPEWDLSTFNGAIWAIEQSNDGYVWNWDERTLKGKTVGINVREGTYNGVPYTRIGRLESVKEIREGKVKVMKPLAPTNSAPQSDSLSFEGFTAVEEPIPF